MRQKVHFVGQNVLVKNGLNSTLALLFFIKNWPGAQNFFLAKTIFVVF